MQWDSFRTWCLADYRKAKATVDYNVGRLRAMQRLGLDVDAFLSSPRAAREEGRRLVAALKSAGKSAHVVRTFQKVLNWLLDYGKHLQPDVIWGEPFELEPEPKSMLATVPEGRVHELWTYTDVDLERTRLRRALAWMAYWTRLRRSENAGLRLDDLDVENLVVRAHNPAKRGIPNERIVPDFFFHADLPLGDYLAHRPVVPGRSELWLRRNRRTGQAVACTSAAVYVELYEMGRALRMRLNFIATRRAGSTMLDEAGVHPRVGAAQNGQNAVASWEKYVGRVTTDRARREFARAGIPGFSARAEASQDAVELARQAALTDEQRYETHEEEGTTKNGGKQPDGHGGRHLAARPLSCRIAEGPQEAPRAEADSTTKGQSLYRRPTFFVSASAHPVQPGRPSEVVSVQPDAPALSPKPRSTKHMYETTFETRSPGAARRPTAAVQPTAAELPLRGIQSTKPAHETSAAPSAFTSTGVVAPSGAGIVRVLSVPSATRTRQATPDELRTLARAI